MIQVMKKALHVLLRILWIILILPILPIMLLVCLWAKIGMKRIEENFLDEQNSPKAYPLLFKCHFFIRFCKVSCVFSVVTSILSVEPLTMGTVFFLWATFIFAWHLFFAYLHFVLLQCYACLIYIKVPICFFSSLTSISALSVACLQRLFNSLQCLPIKSFLPCYKAKNSPHFESHVNFIL